MVGCVARVRGAWSSAVAARELRWLATAEWLRCSQQRDGRSAAPSGQRPNARLGLGGYILLSLSFPPFPPPLSL